MSDKKTQCALIQARAIHELQLQAGFGIATGKRGKGSLYAAEFLDEKQWKSFRAHHPVLLLSSARAQVLGLKAPRGACALDVGGLSLKELWQLVAGTRAVAPDVPSLSPPLFGEAMIGLAKRAGVLPALIWLPGQAADGLQTFDLKSLSFKIAVTLLRGETVSLPVEGAEDSTLTGFRTQYGAGVHLALAIGKPKGAKPPLVRVHSSCVTGDLLGSLRCDCGGQLRASIARMQEEGAGILLYLHQEGRDIGISSKLRAYALQEQGLDTFEANQQLGFEEDERDFSIAAAMLTSLGHTRIRLLTNNPDKIGAFTEHGITVEKRLPLQAGHSAHNQAYREAKQKKRGHHG